MIRSPERRYIKRIWRVPKDRGPVEYLAWIVTKALVKHGWPAKWERPLWPNDDRFVIHHVDSGDWLPPDFAEAVSVAVRIAARTYRIDVAENAGVVSFNRLYRVTEAGKFKEIKRDLPRQEAVHRPGGDTSLRGCEDWLF